MHKEGNPQKKHCKHERASKKWIDTDYSPGFHRFELGRKYKYNCPDCGKIWIKWE